MARKTERQKLLEQGEARGILKPEHKQELAQLRAASGGGSGGGGSPSAQDRKALQESSERAAAANRSLRLYSEVQPALERFNPGPAKGTLYDMVMPNDGGGILDNVGSLLGTPVRALLPKQDKDDYQRIEAARAERVALRQMEQKGTQTNKDAELYSKADIGPGKSLAANRTIMANARRESLLTGIRAQVQARWVSKFGSTSRAAGNGMTFEQAVNLAERDFLANTNKRRQAPPSTRRPGGGWSVQEVK